MFLATGGRLPGTRQRGAARRAARFWRRQQQAEARSSSEGQERRRRRTRPSRTVGVRGAQQNTTLSEWPRLDVEGLKETQKVFLSNQEIEDRKK